MPHKLYELFIKKIRFFCETIKSFWTTGTILDSLNVWSHLLYEVSMQKMNSKLPASYLLYVVTLAVKMNLCTLFSCAIYNIYLPEALHSHTVKQSWVNKQMLKVIHFNAVSVIWSPRFDVVRPHCFMSTLSRKCRLPWTCSYNALQQYLKTEREREFFLMYWLLLSYYLISNFLIST